MRNQYRQGDVLVRQMRRFDVSSLKQVPPTRGRVVLARGEATGHAHTIDESKAKLYEGADGRFYLQLEGAALLEHEEHAAIALPVGYYEVIRQREYSPGRIRRVED